MIVSEQARAVEALLFASESPLAVEEITRRLDSGGVEIALAELTEAYAGRGINLVERGGRWHFGCSSVCGDWKQCAMQGRG